MFRYFCLLLLLLVPPYAVPRPAEAEAGRRPKRQAAARRRSAATVKRRSRRQPSGAARRCPRAEEPRPAAEGEVFDSLLERARADGEVAVVVRLCVAFRPEGELGGEAAARRQRAEIARAQEALLGSLTKFRVTSVKKFEFTPFLSLSVDAGGLLHLKASALVAGIDEDASLPPARG
jgi:hypothetical protein